MFYGIMNKTWTGGVKVVPSIRNIGKWRKGGGGFKCAGAFFLSIIIFLVWSLAPSLNLRNFIFFLLTVKLQSNMQSKRTTVEPYSEPTCLFLDILEFVFQKNTEV